MNRIGIRLGIFLVMLIAMVGSASADHACVADDGSGDAYFCGDTVLKSCTLNGSMTCPNTGDGLIIGANNIVIDGAGYKMTGNENNCLCYNDGLADEQNPAPHCGIRNNGNYDNVVIKNLEIENFCTGIALGDSTHISVDNNTVTGCYIHHNGNDTECVVGGDVITHGIHMVATNNCNITKNEITYNDGTGDQCGGGGNGIFMFGKTTARGNYNNFTCNNLSYNAKSGFFMKKMCMYCIISYNKATNNGEGGIVPMCKKSLYNEIKYNNMSNNVQVGYRSQGGDNDLMFNTIMNNGPTGIDIISCTDCGKNTVITNNTVCGHTTDIKVGSPAENTGDSNTCDSSDIAGACDWNCDNKVSAYFDFDGDGYYSDDPADCSCTNPAGGKCACCNPGLFNSSHASMLKAAGTCVLSGDTHDDPNDCNNSIMGEPKPKQPDLIVVNKSETWVDETNYTVSYRVQNIGNGTSNESVACVSVDGTLQTGANKTIGELAPNAYSPVKTVGPFTMSGTSDTINVCADCDANNTEWNETNNCLVNEWAANQPDLTITDKHEDWIDKAAGTYNITYTVKNIGTATAGASKTKVMIDGSPTGSPDNVPQLAPAAEYTGTIGPHTVSGDFDTIKLCADGPGHIAESDETNNCIENKWYKVNLTIYVDPASLNITPQDQFDINITVDPAGLEIYGVEYYLTYNTSVLRAESQVKGPFLGTTGETIVVVNEIDRGAGIVSYAETRKDSADGVNVTGISSVIQFTAIGNAGECTDLDLYGVIIVNTSGGQVSAIVVDGEVCLTNNHAPVAAGCTKHLHNNAQKKFECLAQLCSNSTDPDGDDIVYIRWSFGDGEYGTSEGLGECPCKYHSYTSWIWEPFGDPTGHYVPFNASLTVTDNGDPQLEDTTYFDVNVYMAGDANADGTVNILDAVLIGLSWDHTCTGTDCCELLWTGDDTADRADLNNDCKVNILDAVIVGTMWDHNAYYPV